MKIKLQQNAENDLEIIIARNVDEIENIRPVWQQMQMDEAYPIINADIDRYLSVLKAIEDKCSPLIFLVKQNGKPQAMIIGRLEKHTIPINIGYKTILKPKLRCITVVYGGILGQPDKDISSLLVWELMKVLRRGEADVIFFNHLRKDSAFYRQVHKIPGFLCRSHFSENQPHWRMSLPESLDKFYQSLSKKHRANLRRAVRNLEEEQQNQFQIVHYRSQDEIDRLLQDVEEISVKTYQHALNAGFRRNSLNRSILNTDTENKRLLMTVLYNQKQPCAFQWGTIFGRTYFLEKIGYDPKWAKYQIGSVLFVKVLDFLCGMERLEFIDFGFGDADYKRSYGSESWSEADTKYLFAPRLYPILINLLNNLNSGLTMAVTWAIQKIKIYAWIKRIWRRRLQKTAAGGISAD